jgi:hypothetical protein
VQARFRVLSCVSFSPDCFPYEPAFSLPYFDFVDVCRDLPYFEDVTFSDANCILPPKTVLPQPAQKPGSRSTRPCTIQIEALLRRALSGFEDAQGISNLSQLKTALFLPSGN